ncbi:stage II sporulation protein D [Clostridia bacterium]|nr:stage II sporulation protein D [Clostridia bacterium]
MKQSVIMAVILLAVLFALPLMSVNNTGGNKNDESPPDAGGTPSPAGGEVSLTDDGAMLISVKMPDKVVTMSLADYLYGAVAAEMPAAFPEEALKAQAVASRTLAMNRILLNRGGKGEKSHEGADVCTDYGHCEAWTRPEESSRSWGADASEYERKVKKAVADTNAVLILYNEEPIVAAFHSASSGATERAADVWGAELPYLQSVESPGETDAPRYYGISQVEPDEIKRSMTEKYPEAVFPPDPAEWFGDEERSTSGGILSITIGGVKISGGEAREMFALNSTNFSVVYQDGVFTFNTVGFGHGVGMSQYGARAMALEGKSCEEILGWYYSDIKIGKYT